MVAVVAHRGYSAKYPENTLLAFRKAVELGVDCVEFDVIPSADGRIMVIHDRTVDRTTDGTGRVVDMTFDELRALDAGAHKGAGGERIPTLEEAIEAIGPGTGLNINFNFNDADVLDERERRLLVAYEEAIVRIVRRAGAMARSVFAIYPVEQIVRVRSHDPEANCVPLGGLDGDEYIRRCVELGCRVTQPGRHLMSAEWVSKLHDAGLVGNVFYANTEQDMRRYIAMGIDGILTDEPELLLKVRAELSG